MWVRDGKAFVWIDKANGSMDLVGDMPFQVFDLLPGLGLARLLLPRSLDVSPDDKIGVYPVLGEESDLGPGPWIG